MSEPTKEQIEKARKLSWLLNELRENERWENQLAIALAAETAPLHEKIASLEKQLAEVQTWFRASEMNARDLQDELNKARNGAPLPGEVNEHADLSFRLLRTAKSTDFRQLVCGTCSGSAEFAISLSDNGQWNLECSGCQESGAVLSEVLAKLR